MNSGAEAVESALKLARKWSYLKKGIPDGEAIIITMKDNFHGRTIGIISSSTDPMTKADFGPLLPGFVTLPYNDVNALENYLEQHSSRVAALLLEPIQGEAGVIVPSPGYLTSCYNLCKKHGVLFIDDEIQTGLARTGRMLATDWEPDVKPDILILGKALSGGMLPVSCILSNNDIMDVFKPGQHGSTFGGNPLASAVAIRALEVLQEENLARNAENLGKKLREMLVAFKNEFPFIIDVRGKGLLNAIEISPNHHKTAWQMCLYMKDLGLLAKPTHDHTIRLAPPLVLTEQQLDECVDIIKRSLVQMAS
eukprot:TRINITY_DN8825_c0_g1_i6.p1 TRINITY_DN8825_c0_g1~~TRINITY_DN8825_c0_g1_i6.p1  ORF type:complete len:309 (-),score=54.06 TRINITY_DN8825_c0_g1_i6:192-1118(-)